MMDIFSLKDKSVLVTGASSGIGRSIAVQCSKSGANVTITGRDQARLNETLGMMDAGSHEVIVADLTKKDDLKKLVAKPYNGVVFNAGVVEYLPIKFLTEEKIRAVFDTNFNSSVLLCQQLLKNKMVAKQGSLVFISSVSSKLGVVGTAMYASSKAAIQTFSKVVASEVASQGIRSNTISPGVVVTAMTEQAKSVAGGDNMKEGEKAYPLGYGNTNDVASSVVFLLSDASRWMTGSDLLLDGGLVLN
jgi:NAD(P)-dependent dehydrogenase (short-subunit alcohol dehydrogenase family)